MPKWTETGVTVLLCDGCFRIAKTVEGLISSARPLYVSEPTDGRP